MQKSTTELLAVKMKAVACLPTTLIAVALIMMLLPPRVNAQSNNSGLSAKPSIEIIVENGIYTPPEYTYPPEYPPPLIYSESGNITLKFEVRLPDAIWNAQGTVYMAPGGYLTFVSYKASWQNNQTMDVFTNIEYGIKTDVGQFNYTLTNITYGNQQLEINASSVVFGLNIQSGTTYPVYGSNEYPYDFTVAPPPTPTPTPSKSAFNSVSTIIIIAIITIAILITFVSILLYRRHRKTANLKK
jgi:hypothetical protein